jgi:hypothetical protein
MGVIKLLLLLTCDTYIAWFYRTVLEGAALFGDAYSERCLLIIAFLCLMFAVPH